MTALRFTPIVLATSFALAARVPAQARTSAAVDATVGAGVGKGGEHFDRAIGGGRLAASLRRWPTPRVGVFGELSMDWLAVSIGHDLVCRPSSRGGCMTPYPELSGPAATVGVVTGRADRRFEARLGAGGGAYSADGTRVGAAVSQLDAAVFPVPRVGLVVAGRWIVVPRYRSDQLSMVTWGFGLRLR
jgi:hypothetical protein